MAAISKAFAPPRSPISARSRAGLSMAEAALLVALPQSPEAAPAGPLGSGGARRARPRARPHRRGGAHSRRRGRARQARRRADWPQADAGAGAARRRAGHRGGAAAQNPSPDHRRAAAEDRCRSWRASGRGRSAPIMSVAIVAVDHATGEVLARVASADYFDERRAGQVDMTQALRSPGSALKPFIYGLAFEDGLVHPETLIEDRPVRYGVYAPENFDMTFQGTVSARRALATVAQRAGGGAARQRSARAGCRRVSRRPARRWCCPRARRPGLAMALGGVGVKLTDLTMLLRRARARRHGAAAGRAHWTSRVSKCAAAADRSGRRLVCRQRADRHAAAGERRGRPHRLQDRHVVRLSRRLVGRLRRHAARSASGSGGRTARRCPD